MAGFTGTNASETHNFDPSENPVDLAGGTDTLLFGITDADLSTITLTNTEILKAGLGSDTRFIVDAADLVSNGSVLGSGGTDTLVITGTQFDVSSTALSSIEILRGFGNTATTFIVDQADLASGGTILAGSGSDTLVANGTLLDVSHTVLNGVETLKAGKSAATTFIVTNSDLASNGSVIGSSGNDTLQTADDELDVSATTLSSVEILKAGTTLATLFSVNGSVGGDNLASGGSVVGGSGSDTLMTEDNALNLTSTTLTSVETLQTDPFNGAGTFTVDQADLAVHGQVIGTTTNADTLVINGTSLNLASTTLFYVEKLQAGLSTATTFIVDQADISGAAIEANLSGGSVVGSSGNDTLQAQGTLLDLRSTTLTSVEILKATVGGTTFIVDSGAGVPASDLATNGSVLGANGNDTLQTADTGLDLTHTTLTSVEILKAGNASSTTFTVDQTDLASGGSVIGSDGTDSLVINGSSLNLTSTILSSVEILKAGMAATATTFTVDQADLATTNGQVWGTNATDTLAANGTSLDLSSTFLSSVEILQATKGGTVFTVVQQNVNNAGTGTLAQILGSTGNDTLALSAKFSDSALDLTSTTLSSVEILKTNGTNTTFIVNQDDLSHTGQLVTSVLGSTGTDTLQLAQGETVLNLSSTTLSSVEIIKGQAGGATTIVVDQADLATNGSVYGGVGSDVLQANGTLLDLSHTMVSSIENLVAGKSTATTFIVNQADLAFPNTNINGSSGNDTLQTADNVLDLTSAQLTSIEILKAGLSTATTFIVNGAIGGDLASGGSVIGSSGMDTLQTGDNALNLTSTTLTSVEILKAANSGTTFTVDQADLATGGSVQGVTFSDKLVINGTSLNLASTTTTNIGTLAAGKSVATTFIVDQASLYSQGGGGSVVGSTGTDTLQVQGTLLDLTSTTLSSVEILKAGNAAATTFILNTGVSNSDLAALGSAGQVIGNSGVDTLESVNALFDLTSTTLTSVEILKMTASATNLIVDQADLASGGSVIGTNSADVLTANGTILNLASTTLSGVNILQTFNNAGTTFTVDQADLTGISQIIGAAGNDVLAANGTLLDLTSTSLSSVEILQATKAAATFIVNQDDVHHTGQTLAQIQGSAGTDTLITADTQLDLTSTAVTSVEILKAGNTGATTFTVNQGDLASGGSVIGTAANNDTLATADTELNLSSTTLSSVEILTTTASGVTFTVDQADLASGGSVQGSAGTNRLVANGTTLNLSSTTLTNVKVLSATKAATTFTVDQADLASGGSVDGSTGNDTLLVNGVSVDLSSTALSSVEILKATTSNSTTFTVDQADLIAGGSIIGSTSNDTLVAHGTVLDLSGTTLTSIETLKAGNSLATTFIVDQADLAPNGAVIGSTGSDTLATAGTALNLTSTTLTSVEALASTNATGTTFTIDQTDLSGLLSITGSTGTQDALVVASSVIDLTGATVTGIETLKAGLNIATTFIVNQGDLDSFTAIVGSSGSDTLQANGTQMDLSGTTLSSVETLKAGNSLATTFTVDQADLASGGSVIGSTGNDTLTAAGTLLDLTSTLLTSVEKLATANTTGTTFKLDVTDFAAVGSIAGSTGSDTLTVVTTNFDVTGKSISGIETLQAALAGTTFTVADPSAFAAINGTTGTDTLVSTVTNFYLTSTTLSSVEILKAGATTSTFFSVNQADLASGGSVIGTANGDFLGTADSQLNLSSTTLTSIEVLRADRGSIATTIIVDQADLASIGTGGEVRGSTATDTLAANGTTLDLSSTFLSNVEILQATKAGTIFTVNQIDVHNSTTNTLTNINGSAGTDTLALAVADTALDLTSTTLSSVEILKALNGGGVTFTIDSGDVSHAGQLLTSILGSAGVDTLAQNAGFIDLSSTTLSSVEILKGGSFKVDQADLATNGSVLGSGSFDTLQAAGTLLDLRSTTLSSVEILSAGKSTATTFIVNQDDIHHTNQTLSFISGSTGTDTLVAGDTELDLTSSTLQSVEILKAGMSGATLFTVNGAPGGDLASGGSVIGSTGLDTLQTADGALNLTSTTLTSIEILKATLAATAFIVDQADLAANGSVLGSVGGSDTLTINGTSLNLTSTTLSSVEVLKAGTTAATTFIVDQADLAAGGANSQVIGNTGTLTNDTLQAQGTLLDLSSTTLIGVEILKATVGGTTFIVDNGVGVPPTDLASGGSVIGASGNDTLASADTGFNLTSTTLTSVEILKATSGATTFTVDKADLASGGSVIGGGGTDTLIIAGTDFNLASTSLSGVEILQAGSSNDTTFTVDQADLITFNGQVKGTSTGLHDTVKANGTSLDLSSTFLSSIEVLQATKSGTLFTVGQSNLTGSGGTVTDVKGSSGTDTLMAASGESLLDLTSTTLSSVEILKTAHPNGTTFFVDASDLASGGSVIGNTSTDTLKINGTILNLASTTLTSVDALKAGLLTATTFIVDQADLASTGGQVFGSTGNDTLQANGTLLDLSHTSLSSIETLIAGKSTATTFIVNGAPGRDLSQVAFVRGESSGNDTLQTADTALDISSTALSSIEILKAGLSTATTFTVNQNDLAHNGSVIGSSGTDTLALGSGENALNLTATTLTSVEILQASSAGTALTVDQADLASGGSVIGGGGTDTLLINGTSLNLTSTTLSSVEQLASATSLATTFTVNQDDLSHMGQTLTRIIGDASANDTLVAADTALDLSSTSLSSIEILQATKAGTTFTVNQDDLSHSGQTLANIKGVSGNDTLQAADVTLDLRSTLLTSVEILKAENGGNTTFTVDQADLASGGSVMGTSGTDTLTINGTSLNLSSTTLTSVEKLQAGLTSDTTFIVDQADLASTGGGQVNGSSGSDTLVAAGTSLDLTSTALTSVDILQAGKATATTFTIDNADLNSIFLIKGSSGVNTLVSGSASDTGLDLTQATLISIEILKAGTGSDTTFKVFQDNLASVTSIIGGAGTDTVSASTSLDLTHTTLSSIEILKSSNGGAVHFTVDQADLASGGTVNGGGAGELTIHGTSLDLTSTTVTNVDILSAGLSTATTFIVDQADLSTGGGGEVHGSSGVDTLIGHGSTLFDLSSTALTSIEILKGTSTDGTVFVVDQADLASGGSVIDNVSLNGSSLIVNGNNIDLSHTTLSGVTYVQSNDFTSPTTFTIGNNLGGTEIGLTTNGKHDVIDLAVAYRVTDATSDATIMAHTIVVSEFQDGAITSGGDTIDLSQIDHGAPTTHTDISGFISLVNPATLKQALDYAASADGSTTSSVVTFQYHGDTYVLVNNSAGSTLTANDAVVKLTGLHTLTDGANLTF